LIEIARINLEFPGRPTVALGTMLEPHHRHVADKSPEVVHGDNSVDALATVRTVGTADLVVDELAGVGRARSGTVDKKSEVGWLVRRDGVVEKAVVEAGDDV